MLCVYNAPTKPAGNSGSAIDSSLGIVREKACEVGALARWLEGIPKPKEHRLERRKLTTLETSVVFSAEVQEALLTIAVDANLRYGFTLLADITDNHGSNVKHTLHSVKYPTMEEPPPCAQGGGRKWPFVGCYRGTGKRAERVGSLHNTYAPKLRARLRVALSS